jgi:hypothetical protein
LRTSSVRRRFRLTRIESHIDFEWWGLGGIISLRTKGYLCRAATCLFNSATGARTNWSLNDQKLNELDNYVALLEEALDRVRQYASGGPGALTNALDDIALNIQQAHTILGRCRKPVAALRSAEPPRFGKKVLERTRKEASDTFHEGKRIFTKVTDSRIKALTTITQSTAQRLQLVGQVLSLNENSGSGVEIQPHAQ